MKIKYGSKTAIVGYSGCGKSTIMQILMRFYDIDEGEILLDNINIKDYDIHYLRSIIGFVNQ
jgi:subfamily B ATP-binding cassette protein MsbA